MDWQSFVNALPGVAKFRELQGIPNRAAESADRAYPNQGWDATMKNAYRHALGTGMVAQALGGGPVASGMAQMAGWGWEAPTQLNPWASQAARIDSRHDLNANALGAEVAKHTGSTAELEAALKSFGDRAVVRTPPGTFERGVGYLTRSK